MDDDPSISLNIVAGPAAPAKGDPGKRKGFRKNKKKRKAPPKNTVATEHRSDKRTKHGKDNVQLPIRKNESGEGKQPVRRRNERSTAATRIIETHKPFGVQSEERSSNDDDSINSSAGESSANPIIQIDEAKKADSPDIEADPEKHAAYLATFHARPYELDRRAGAVRKLPSTRPSHHLHADTQDISWESLGITNRTLQRRIPHAIPTHIQCQSVPAILTTDKTTAQTGILLQAETGSGKTLAYAAPCLQLCLQPTNVSTTATTASHRRRIPNPRCLILVPTRELAYQTLACIQPLLAGTPAVPGLLVGGVASNDKTASSKHRKSEKAAIRKGWAVVVATASRLLDHIQTTQALTLEEVHTVVLDEADRLVLDPAHCKAIQQIWEHLPATVERTILVSATLPKEEILKALQTETETRYKVPSEWITVTAGRRKASRRNDVADSAEDDAHGVLAKQSLASTSSNPKQLRHAHLVVHAKLRWPALIACLLTSKHKKTVVFCSTCAAVDYLGQLLPHILPTEQYSVHCLHGNMTLQQRQSSLSQFTSVTSTENASSGILLATDVAGRGLNLGDGMNNVTILQYDPPSCCSDYVHRAGRAARAGAPGQCLLFLLPSEVGVLSVLEDVQSTAMSLSHVLEQAAKVYAGTSVKEGASSLKDDSSGRKKRPAEAFATQLQFTTEAIVEAKSLRAAAAAAFCAHVRAYTVKEKVLKPFFPPKALHLGHVARSFGWKGAPSELNKALQHTKSNTSKRPKEESRNKMQRMAQVAKALEGMGSM